MATTALKTGVLLPSKAPNLPIAPVDYTQQYQDQFGNALRLYFNQLDNYTQGSNNTFATQAAYDSSYIEAYDRSASIAITTTPTLLKPASYLPPVVDGISYDPLTGVFTFLYAGTYSLSISLNITTTNANQIVYLYAQKNIGGGWVNNANSGKEYQLTNGSIVQFTNSQSVYRQAGEQTRYYIYSNGSTSSLVTSTLPGTSPTVYVPAIRIQFA